MLPEGAGAFKKVYVRLPGKGNSKTHGARPVHSIIPMVKGVLIHEGSSRGGRLFGDQVEVELEGYVRRLEPAWQGFEDLRDLRFGV